MLRSLALFALCPSLLWGAFEADAAVLPSDAVLPTVHELRVPAKDGTVLHAEIDLPSNQAYRAVVLLVPGTGGFDRDGWFGHSGTPRDFIFAQLSRALNQAGLAVIRFDERGRTCPDGGHSDAQRRCADAALVETVTPENKASDVADIAAAALADPALQGDALMVLAHSEGLLTTARAFEEHELEPAAIIAIGGIMGSPKQTIRWQAIDRQIEAVESMDSNGDGIVTRAEIIAGWQRQGLSASAIAAASPKLADKRTFAEIEGRRPALIKAYNAQQSDAMAHSGDAPYLAAGKPVASYSWWQMWFTDDMPVAKRLMNFHGPVTLFYGGDDSQTRPEQQIAAAKQYLKDGNLTTRIFPELGHTLGESPLFGPIRPSAMQALVQSAQADAALCEKGCKAPGPVTDGQARDMAAKS